MRLMSKNIAIIVGNGKSREQVELRNLVGNGTIYGCNALYRDFDGYDYLVAIDERMIDEIKTTEKRLSGQAIFPPENERYEETTGRRNNAGMVAMREAIRKGADTLYCLGFDFILAGADSVINVYGGSKNYEPHTQEGLMEAGYHRMQYLEWFAAQYPNVKFVFVIPDNGQVKPIDADNIIGMRMSKFTSKLNG
jgi:hypothetical protein